MRPSAVDLSKPVTDSGPVGSWLVGTDGTRAVAEGYYAQRDPARGYAAGYVTFGSFDADIASFPTNHVMVVAAGDVYLTSENGPEWHIATGEAAAVPRGARLHWRNSPGTSVYFMNMDGAAGSGALQPVRLDPAAPVSPVGGPPAELITSSPPPTVGRSVLFKDSTGHMLAGIWEATPYTRNAAGFAHDELMHLLEGTVRFTDTAGRTYDFGPGDTFIIPRQTPCAWASPKPLRKIFCNIYPVPQ